MVGCGQRVPAKQQVTTNIKVFDLCTVVGIHIGEYDAESFDRCRSCSSRYEEQVFSNSAIQGREEPLRTERVEQRRIDTVDIAKSDWSVCWINKICAYLNACPWREEYDSPRRVADDGIVRQLGGGEASRGNLDAVY